MSKPVQNYGDARTLYQGLARSESGAILYLHGKTMVFLRSWAPGRQLSTQDQEEITEDAVVLTIEKIETGDYVFEGKDPCAYAAGVAKNMVFNFLRKHKRHVTHELQEWDAPEEAAVEKYLHQKEVQVFIGQALNQLKDPCRQLIILHHLEGRSDDEVIREKLTPYGTVQSLRSTRGDCMKKLRRLVSALKTHF